MDGLARFMLTILLFISFVSSFETFLQVPFNVDPPAWASYGFKRPGIYRIINYGYQFAASVNESSMGTAIVSMPLADYDDTQAWLIAAVNDIPEYMIFNKATGAALAGNISPKPARGVEAPPYDKKARWKMDFDTFASVDGRPAVLTNVGLKGVLDLASTGKAARTPILVYPKNTPVSRNQGWYLQSVYIEDLQASQAMHGRTRYMDKCGGKMDADLGSHAQP